MSDYFEDKINFKPDRYKVITDESAHNLFIEPVYSPIIQALRYKYLTMIELEQEYNKIVENQIKRQFSDSKEIEKLLSSASRKGPTLYRYVSTLKDHNIVTIGGTRIRMGQIAKEYLYCLTANVFYYKHDIEKLWKSKASKEILVNIQAILEKILGYPDISLDTLRDFIIHINTLREEKQIEMMDKITLEDLNYLDGLDINQIRYLSNTLDYLIFILHSELYEKELKEIFRRK